MRDFENGFEKDEESETDTDPKQETEKQFASKDRGPALDGLEAMANQDISDIQKSFSNDERANAEYQGQYQLTKGAFVVDCQGILGNQKLSPEEKTKQIEARYREFQTEIGSIQGTKEAMDSERNRKQTKNMEKTAIKTAEANDDFYQKFLKGMKTVKETEARQKLAKNQEFARMVREDGNREQTETQTKAPQEIQKNWPNV